MPLNPDPAAQLIEANRAGLEAQPGHWSLDPRKAREQLAQYQLPGPDDWILKFVQAAVAAGAPELTIQLHNHHVQFQFQFALPWTLDKLQAEILNPELTPDRALEHLKRGLWTAVLDTGATMTLQSCRQADKLEWNGQQIRRLPAPQLVAHDRITLHYPPTTSVLSAVSRAARRNLALQQALQQQAYLCPIPLKLDQRRLDHLHCQPIENSARLLALMSSQHPPVTQRIHPPLPAHRIHSDHDVTYLAAFGAIIVDRPHQDGQLALQEWGVAQLTSSLTWVLDGVKLLRETGPRSSRGIAVHAFASAHDLPTDLSGFTLRPGPQLEQKRQQIWNALHDHLAPCCQEHLTARINRLTSPLHRGVGGFLKVAAVGLLATGHPLLAGLSLAGLAYPAQLTSSRQPLLELLSHTLARFPE